MTKILIINQHGCNRGDEAACRGMVYGLKRFINDAHINILTINPLWLDKFDDINFQFNLYLQNLGKKQEIYKLIRQLFSFFTGIKCTQEMSKIFGYYKEAQLIISAPGGPYIGDLYPKTEFEALFHLLIGILSRKPIMIYAPSMGPFSKIPHSIINVMRKTVLEKVDLITVRESISAKHLADLGVHSPYVCITADSALQKPVDSSPGNSLLEVTGLQSNNKYIGVIPLDLDRFMTTNDKMRYIELLVKFLKVLPDKFGANLVFFPQGFGEWRDRPFFEFLVSVAGLENKSVILPETLNSDEIQVLEGKMDALVSFRYHPGIFAVRQSIPCTVISYEHKMKGFMADVGLSDFCLELNNLTVHNLISKIEETWNKRDEMRRLSHHKIEILERESLKNSYLAYLLLNFYSQHRPMVLREFIKQELERNDWC